MTVTNREESMQQSTAVSIDNVKEVLIETLGLEERADALRCRHPASGVAARAGLDGRA